MNVLEWQAQATISAARMLGHWVATTSEERLGWTPSVDETSKTRSVLNQALECITVNRRFGALLKGEEFGGEIPEPKSGKEAKEQILVSANEFAEVLKSLDESVLTKKFPTRRGEMDGAFLVSLPAGHMMYHGGQVNFIQTLYGDTEFRFPED